MPPPLQREVTAKGHFLLPYTPPPPLTHARMCLACSYLNVYSSIYYVVTTLLSLLNMFACSLAEGCVRVVQDYDSDTAA